MDSWADSINPCATHGPTLVSLDDPWVSYKLMSGPWATRGPVRATRRTLLGDLLAAHPSPIYERPMGDPWATHGPAQ